MPAKREYLPDPAHPDLVFVVHVSIFLNSNWCDLGSIFFVLLTLVSLVVLGCGQTSSQNCTYFESTAISNGLCRATICKATSNICQVSKSFNCPITEAWNSFFKTKKLSFRFQLSLDTTWLYEFHDQRPEHFLVRKRQDNHWRFGKEAKSIIWTKIIFKLIFLFQVTGDGTGTIVSNTTQCLTDSFVVTGSSLSHVPVLCGKLTGEHS